MIKHIINITWYLSHQYTFHAVYFEDFTAIPSSQTNTFKILYEIDYFLRHFQIIEHVRSAIDVSIFSPKVNIPYFYIRNNITGQIIVYPHDIYGVIHRYYDLNGQYNEIRTKSLYNFLEENRIWTSINGLYPLSPY